MGRDNVYTDYSGIQAEKAITVCYVVSLFCPYCSYISPALYAKVCTLVLFLLFSIIFQNVIPPASLFLYKARSVELFSSTLTKIFVENFPVTGGSRRINHNCPGTALNKNTQSSFANRSHLVIGISSLMPCEALIDSTGVNLASEWADKIVHEIEERSLALDMGYQNFTSESDMDTVRFFLFEATQRLRAVKRKYDPENFSSRGCTASLMS
jgi:hypothetical protein